MKKAFSVNPNVGYVLSACGVHDLRKWRKQRNGFWCVEVKRDEVGFFPDGNYPGSALITVSNFARPGMLIEIQGVAVMGG